MTGVAPTNAGAASPSYAPPAARAARTVTETRSAARPADVLLVALSLAMLGGLGEAALVQVARHVLHRFTHSDPRVVWMAPASCAMIFALPAVVMALAARRWPGRDWLRDAVVVFGFLAALGVAQNATTLHPAAVMLLAAGVAVQAGALASRFAPRVRRALPALAGVLVALVLALGAGRAGWLRLREARAAAALPAAPAGAPNVIVIVLDAVRASALSLYGNARPISPNIDRLAREGVTFRRASAPASWTLPSHAGLFTGRWPQEMSADWKVPLDGRHPTLAEQMAERGYRTAGFVANYRYTSTESGLDRGFAHYEDFLLTPAAVLAGANLGRRLVYWVRERGGDFDVVARKWAPSVRAELGEWLARQEAGRPFFVFLNFFDAHDPYLPPPPWNARFGPRGPRDPVLSAARRLTPAEARAELEAYEASVAFLDDEIGRLAETLRARGVLDNTLLVITADHGEEFGEHGLFTHGNDLYEPVLHVPLVMRWPGRLPAGASVEAPVSTRNLAATVLDLTGGIPAAGDPPDAIALFPGRSLVPYWDATRAAPAADSALLAEVRYAPGLPAWYPVSRGNLSAVRLGALKLVRNGDGSEEMYDLDADPAERTNLAADPARGAQLARLRAALAAQFGESPTARR